MTTQRIPLPIEGLDERDAFQIQPSHCPDLRNVRSTLDAVTRSPGTTQLAPTPVPGATTGKAMSVGTFVRNVATGAQVVTHDLGVAPKALILLCSGATAVDTPASGFRWAYGFTDGTTSRAIATAAKHAASPSENARRHAAKVITILKSDGTVAAECDWSAWGTTSFTLNWTTADTTAEEIAFIAVGHGSVTAAVLDWTLSTSASNQAVTGSGFSPQIVLHLTAGLASASSSTGMVAALGAMGASSGQWAMSMFAPNAQTGSSQAGAAFSGSVAMLAGTPAGAEQFRFSMASMDANGFTVSKGTPPSSGVQIFSLCLTGFGNAVVGNFTKTTDAAPVEQAVTGLGFQPLGGMLHTIGFQTTDKYPVGLQYDASLMVGGFSSAAQVSTDAFQDGQAYPTQTGNQTSAAYVWADHGGGGGSFDLPMRVVGRMQSLDSDGFTLNWLLNTYSQRGFYWAVRTSTSAFATVGIPRNYTQAQFTTSEKAILLTDKSAFIYNQATSLFDPTAEVYTASAYRRFGIANTQDVVAWSNGLDNIRCYDGASFSALVSSGTDHTARILLPFNDRIVSVFTRIAGTDHPTQIRWPVSGNCRAWTGVGSGVLEIIETSNFPLTSGFVLGERAYLTKQRELIELIATGTISPVFRQETRIRGIGITAPYSVGLGEYFAFFLGPDNVYQWDGQNLKAVGTPQYRTISALVDYQNLDDVQGTVLVADSQYWLLVPPHLFIYDYQRDRWYRDDYTDIAAIARMFVGPTFTTDIDASEFIILGHNDARSFRADRTVGSFLGNDIDSYVVTKDFEAQQLDGRGQAQPTLTWMNSLREVRFRAEPLSIVEVAASYDRGSTWNTVQDVTVSADGVGCAWFQLSHQYVRFRLRNTGMTAISWRGPMSYEWEGAGHTLA